MSSVTWDWRLFEWLNFDGPQWLDGAMTVVSGIAVWSPLYLLIIYMVWRRYSWRGLLAFAVAMGVAIGLADIVSGIFKHQGILADLLPSFPARPRPMHTADGLEFFTNGYYTGNKFGTVSGHAATIVAIALLSASVIRRRWFTVLIATVATLVCYSRIYLACHFPQDILLGAVLGVLSALCGVWLFRLLRRVLETKN
ncbi:MAG: phosphatase PAP2 family protein [Alistipes sp.]|nr:phosphatase PAP2 family protein [Alistipes sp.]